MPKMLRSFLLGLSGVVLTYTAEWISQTSFGQWTPVIAAMTPVVVNYLRLQLEELLKRWESPIPPTSE